MQLSASKKKKTKRKLNKKRTSKRNKLKTELKDVSSGRSEEDEKESQNKDGLGVEHLIKVLEFLRDAFVKVKEVTTDVAIVRTAMTMLVIVTKNVQFLSFPPFFLFDPLPMCLLCLCGFFFLVSVFFHFCLRSPLPSTDYGMVSRNRETMANLNM